MKIFYSDRYTIPLPEGHRFPMEKYQLVRLELIEDGIVSEDELFEPERASPEVILLADTPEYFHAMRDGTIDPKAMRRIGECGKTLKCERQILLCPQFPRSYGFCVLRGGLILRGILVDFGASNCMRENCHHLFRWLNHE